MVIGSAKSECGEVVVAIARKVVVAKMARNIVQKRQRGGAASVHACSDIQDLPAVSLPVPPSCTATQQCPNQMSKRKLTKCTASCCSACPRRLSVRCAKATFNSP